MTTDVAIHITREVDRLKKDFDSLEEKVTDRNDGVFTKLDAIYKEVLAVRAEQAAHQLRK